MEKWFSLPLHCSKEIKKSFGNHDVGELDKKPGMKEFSNTFLGIMLMCHFVPEEEIKFNF